MISTTTTTTTTITRPTTSATTPTYDHFRSPVNHHFPISRQSWVCQVNYNVAKLQYHRFQTSPLQLAPQEEAPIAMDWEFDTRHLSTPLQTINEESVALTTIIEHQEEQEDSEEEEDFFQPSHDDEEEDEEEEPPKKAKRATKPASKPVSQPTRRSARLALKNLGSQFTESGARRFSLRIADMKR